MPTKRVLRDMLHAEQERCDVLLSELAEVRRTHLAPWECELLHAVEVDTLTKERDSARNVAVRLEQENARLEGLLAGIAHDLKEMDADEAIELESWPMARVIVDEVYGVDIFGEVTL